MKNSILIVFSMILMPLSGCENFVDVNLPASQLTGSKVFDDPTTTNAAITDIYSKLRDTGILSGMSTGASVNFGMYADELTYYGSSVESGLPFENNILPTSSVTSNFWNQSYHQIYCSNAIIEGVKKSSLLKSSDKNRFTGEALFIRALVHFYLLNIYGDIPYVTATDYQQNKLIERTDSNVAYLNIITDLNDAVKLLPEEYLTSERVRPNKSVANALLARVYLYHGDWTEASNTASAVLNNPVYKWENNLDKIFLKESTSTIWQLMPKLSGNNTHEGVSFIFISGSSSFVALTPELINSFEIGDKRKSQWIRAVTNATGTLYHPFKYKQNSNTSSSVEYSIVFRIAEQYLIRAEARARRGDLIGAKEDLNKVRNTAGLTNTNAVTANEIITAVNNERRFEFFTEYGHRFFDLKRTSQLDAILAPVKSGWETTDQLWPIPESELIANPMLGSQNPGY